jgi:hypothetical protein
VSAIASTTTRTLAVSWTLPIDTAAPSIFHQFRQPPVCSTPGVHIGIMMNIRFLADANELCRFGVRVLTAGFSSGKFTPLEVAYATLARAEQVQERFNAFSLIDADAALAVAKESTARWRSGAPLSGIDGVPTTIKDIVWVKDWAVRYGSRTTSAAPCTQDASKNCRPARDRRFQHQHSGNSRSVLFKNPCRTIRLLIRSLCRAVGRRF